MTREEKVLSRNEALRLVREYKRIISPRFGGRAKVMMYGSYSTGAEKGTEAKCFHKARRSPTAGLLRALSRICTSMRPTSRSLHVGKPSMYPTCLCSDRIKDLKNFFTNTY